MFRPTPPSRCPACRGPRHRFRHRARHRPPAADAWCPRQVDRAMSRPMSWASTVTPKFVAWSSAQVAGVPLNAFWRASRPPGHGAAERIAQDVKNSASPSSRRSATYYGVAMAVKSICTAVMRDERDSFCLSPRSWWASMACRSCHLHAADRRWPRRRCLPRPVPLNDDEQHELTVSRQGPQGHHRQRRFPLNQAR